ncbi:MAG: DUF438 domain-containing protein, partial [Promethearchaeota archaeon]
MTELLRNQSEKRELIKKIIHELHAGVKVEDVKPRFQSIIKEITSTELAEIENEIIEEGVPEEDVKRLCDVHVSVFKDSLENQINQETFPGHPVFVFKQENRAIEKILSEIKNLLKRIEEDPNHEVILQWKEKNNELIELDKHYLRKENLLFPFLEKHGFLGPSKVMWALHDDIRDGLDAISSLLSSRQITTENVNDTVSPVLKMIEEMIYKEEKILYPTAMDKLSREEWGSIAQQSDEIGYCLIIPDREWVPTSELGDEKRKKISKDLVSLSTGQFSLEQLELLFTHLPVDITFVDDADIVKYYSSGPNRIFTRTKAVIGRKVQNCHPPKSVHIVMQILNDFKNNNLKKFYKSDRYINMADLP